MENVENIKIVISHKHKDHFNLIENIKKIIINENINYTIISADNFNEETIKEVEDKLKDLKNFFNENDGNIIINSFVPTYENKNLNDNSIVLKISGEFKNKDSYSILLTGDSTENTIKGIAKKYYGYNYISKKNKNNEVNQSEKEKIKEELKEIVKDIFIDVICYISPHHGADTGNSGIWDEYVISQSKYQALCIMSSNPNVIKGKPTLEKVKKLMENINEKNKEKNIKKYYCIPHFISCNLNDNRIKYISVNGKSITPIFVTNDSRNNGYRVIVNSDGLILKDDIIYKQKINTFHGIPLYEYNINKDFTREQELNMAYAFYLAYYYKIENDKKYDELRSEISIKKDKKLDVSSVINSKRMINDYYEALELYINLNNGIDDIIKNTKSYAKILKDKDRVDEFKILFSKIKKYGNMDEFLKPEFIDSLINKQEIKKEYSNEYPEIIKDNYPNKKRR